MFTVTVYLLTGKLTFTCPTRYAALMVVAEWDRLGYDAEIAE